MEYNSVNMPAEQMNRPAPEQVDTSLAKELEARAQYASNEAQWFEESARRHRAVEQACRAALDTLNIHVPQQSVPSADDVKFPGY